MDTITNKPNVSLLRGSSFTAAALVLCAFCLPGSVPVNAGYDGGSLVDNWINVSNYMQTLEGQDAVYTIDDGGRSVNYEFKYDDKYIYGKATSAMAYLPHYLQEYNKLIDAGYTHEQIIDPLSDAGKKWREDTNHLVSMVMATAIDTNQAAVLVQHGGDKVYSGLSTGFDYYDINPWNAGDAYYAADMSNEDAASNMGPWGNHSRELDGIITDDTATSSWDIWNNAAEDGSNSFFDGSMQSYYDFERNNAFYFAIDRSLLGGSTFYLIASILQQESEHYLTFGDEITITVTGVASPEPATLLLFGLGVSALAVARRRK